MLKRIRGGIHPPDRKNQTKNLQVENFIDMEYVFIPLKQHIGVTAKPCVSIGEYVKIGQVIGKAEGVPSIHSSVSGNVEEIVIKTAQNGSQIEGIQIKNDMRYKEVNSHKRKNIENMSKKEFLQIIQEAGISGMGGAMFPTFKKFHYPDNKKAEFLVINGVECEPYLNADNRLMIESFKTILEGIKIIQNVFKIPNVVIGIEDNKLEAIKLMKENLGILENAKIDKLHTIYPQGGEKQLLQNIFKKELEGLPIDNGIIVLNVATCHAIYEAVELGKPLTERIVTIAGDAVKNPKNLWVKLGTPIKDILNYTNVERSEIHKLILGGPMMGVAISNENEVVTKGTNGVLALTKNEAKPYKARECISCGKCLDVCPMGLTPLKYVELLKNNKISEMGKYDLKKCIRCGSCQYICPVNQPMMEAIWIGLNTK